MRIFLALNHHCVTRRVLRCLRAVAFTVAHLLIVWPLTLPAQDTAVPLAGPQVDRRSFSPAFFANYGPLTALDMVQRVPGFTIVTESDRCGFGENAGNVLIDGARPPTKTDDIQTLLERIPANQVERIELLDQVRSDADAAGKGQIVNVVRRSTATIAGRYEAHVQSGSSRPATPFANVSTTVRRRNTTFDFNASTVYERRLGRGPEYFSDGNLQLIERRAYEVQDRYRQERLGAALRTRVNEIEINLNTQMRWEDGLNRRDALISAPNGSPIGTELLLADEPQSDRSIEVGVDAELSLTPRLTTKLIGLYRRENVGFDGLLVTVREGVPSEQLQTINRRRPTETVLRLQNEWAVSHRHQLLFGIEKSLNRLDAQATDRIVSGSAAPFAVNSQVIVRESRFEPFIADVWTISPAWTIDAGAIFEWSELSILGNSTARRQFNFVKPRITATWNASARTHFEFRLERQVAQLDFTEFATSVDLGVGQVDAGNPDLVPEQTTTLTALVRRQLGERGSIQLQLAHQIVRDTQDLVPVSVRDDDGNVSVFDGAGNIGNGRRSSAELELTLPMDWLSATPALAGMELKVSGAYRDSRVKDPVTGLNRRMWQQAQWNFDAELRHDIASAEVAWGLKLSQSAPQFSYFVQELRQLETFDVLEAFVESRKWKLGALRLAVFDVTGSRFRRYRSLYSDTRASGIVTDRIDRERRLDPRYQLSLVGTF